MQPIVIPGPRKPGIYPWLSARTGLIDRARIEAFSRAIAREFRPEKIVLFGSYAYGKPEKDSDVDLLVILRFSGSDSRKAVEIRSRFVTPFPLDLLVRKPEFIESRLKERDMFIELVLTRGQVLYEAKHSRVGKTG